MPETKLEKLRKGDWIVAKAMPRGPVGLVTRVAKDGSWIDIRVRGDGETWTKRMKREFVMEAR